MEDRKIMLRRWAKRVGVVFVFLLLDATVGYYLWTRFSVQMAMRWMVQKAGLPLEVKEARWDANWNDLRNGRVNNLDVLFVLKPTELWIRLRTPIHISKKENLWKLSLEPLVEVRGFPAVKGKVDGEATIVSALNPGKKLDPRGGKLHFLFEPKGGLEYKNEITEAKIRAFQLSGTLKWDPYHPEESKRLHIEADAMGRELSIIHEDLLIEEPSVQASFSGFYDGVVLKNGRASVSEPLELEFTVEKDSKGISGTSRLGWKTKDIFDDRVAKWFESRFSFLRRAKTKGRIGLDTKWVWQESSGFQVKGTLDLDLKKLDLPKKDLFVEGLLTSISLKWPLPHRDASTWTDLALDLAEVNTAKLKALQIRYRVFEDDHGELGVEFESKQAIRQEIFGSAITVKTLEGSYRTSGPTLKAGLEAGPFEISRIQKDLCVAHKNPIVGNVRASYPDITVDGGLISLKGRADATLFGGTVHSGSVTIDNRESIPNVAFWVEGKDLDMQALGTWTRIGDMRGSLDWSLLDAQFKLTPLGPVPMDYHLQVRGRERAGNQIRFYGRAIYNILELMGTREQDFPIYAQWTLKLSTIYRNLFPAVAEYMGFEAVSKDGYTSLRTFDPPGSKNHYFLLGNAFKIPLNTKGVFPVRMQADAFQGWLYGMLEYFKKKQKEAKEGNDDCKPIF